MDNGDMINLSEDGFEGLPRHLPDNCVEYVLFVIDSKLDTRKQLSIMGNVRKAALELSDELTKDYIWQRDPFQLEVKNEKGLVYLQGTTSYGDSVEDEWLIVYLLRRLTKSFENLWVRVFDSDGEFLLVEAANVLPSWLSPEIDSNRVWIYQEKLYIIPLDLDSPEKRPLALGEAVNCLRTNFESLTHSTFIEAEAFYRLDKYPGKITDSMHHSLVKIPRKLAHILHRKPATIAPAVEAFYLRDPHSMKSLITESGKLSFPPEDLVTVSVKFTKVLFAQLKSQRFTPPPTWVSVLKEGEKDSGPAEEIQKRLDRLEMGMKITSGFEMLATNAEIKDSRSARELAILLKDIEEDGAEALPTDTLIQSWSEVARDDNDSWLDINFEEFERELQGKRGPRTGKQPAFGDASIEADLQKIVSRFETFLNDDTAGLDGAELDDMDDDDDFSDEEDSEDEDKEVSFDERQYATMMREMMGLPPIERQGSAKVSKAPNRENRLGLVEEVDESEGEGKDIRQLAAQMESELNELGALKLDYTPKKLRTLERGGGWSLESTRKQVHKVNDDETDEVDSEESGDEEVDVDYNLAKNLLESFKSQAGTAGPAGNILGMMGLRLPRDEEDEGIK